MSQIHLSHVRASMTTSADEKTYRVKGIPVTHKDKRRIGQYLRSRFGSSSAFEVRSIGLDPLSEKHFVATVTFTQIPSCLSDKGEEWTLQDIVVDTHFRGFTPLNLTDHHHQIEYVSILSTPYRRAPPF